jgi:hypothetical protein
LFGPAKYVFHAPMLILANCLAAPRPALLSQCNTNACKGTKMKPRKPKKGEFRTETIMIRVRPSVKRMAVAMAKADDRSLSSFISTLIEAEEKLSHFRKGL